MGFFDNIGNAFKDLGHKIDDNIVKKAQKGSNELNHKIVNVAKTTIHKAEQETKKVTNTIKSGTLNTVNTVKHGTLNTVNTVKQGTLNTVNAVKHEVQKPSFQQGLQKAVQISAGVVALTPVGKGILMAAAAGGDAGSHGGASAYLGLNNTNSTLSFAPGGLLAQQVANVATDGKAGQVLNSTLPDPKRMAMNDAKTIVNTGIHNPSQLKSTLPALAHQNAAQVHAIVKHDVQKPSIQHAISTINKNIPPVIAKPSSTLHAAIPTISKVIEKPNILHSISPPQAIKSTISDVIKPIHDIPKPSLILKPPDIKKVIEKVDSLGNKIKSTLPIPKKSTLDVPPPALDATPSQQITPPSDAIDKVAKIVTPSAPVQSGTTLQLIEAKKDPTTTSSQAVVPYEKFNLINWLLKLLGIY